MRRPKNLGIFLLGIWLILTGLLPFLNVNFSGLNILMALLAIVAGLLLLLQR